MEDTEEITSVVLCVFKHVLKAEVQTNMPLFLLLFVQFLFLKLYKYRNINFCRHQIFADLYLFFWDVNLNFLLKRYFHLSVQVPGPAPNLQVVSVGATSVALSWERPATGNGDIQTYKLFYSEKGQDSEQVRDSLLCHNYELINIWSPTFTYQSSSLIA